MGNCCCSDAPFVFDVEGDMRRIDIGKSLILCYATSIMSGWPLAPKPNHDTAML